MNTKRKLPSLMDLKRMIAGKSKPLEIGELIEVFRGFAASGLIKINGYKLIEENENEPEETQRKQMLRCLIASFTRQSKESIDEQFAELLINIHNQNRNRSISVNGEGRISNYYDTHEGKVEYVLTLINQLPIDNVIEGLKTVHPEYFD